MGTGPEDSGGSISGEIDAKPPVGETAVAFLGSGRAAVGLLAKGAILQILTFGFYRFWTVTQIRRHLWSGTRIGEDELAYTGTARELLWGLIVATALLGAIFGLYLGIGRLMGVWIDYLDLGLVLALYGFGYFATFRARRYRMSRTSFRGSHFKMAGSGLSYAARGVLWDLATVLSLGLAYPWRRAALDRYLLRNARFGNVPGRFTGSGWRLFLQLLPCWLAIVGSLFLASLFPESVLALSLGALFPIPVFIAIALVVRWRLNGVRFGETALASSLPTAVFLNSYAKLTLSGLVMISAIVTFLILVLRSYPVDTNVSFPDELWVTPASHLLLIGFVVFSTLNALHVLQIYFFDRRAWRAIAASLSVINLAAMEGAGSGGDKPNALGEGLPEISDVAL